MAPVLFGAISFGTSSFGTSHFSAQFVIVLSYVEEVIKWSKEHHGRVNTPSAILESYAQSSLGYYCETNWSHQIILLTCKEQGN